MILTQEFTSYDIEEADDSLKLLRFRVDLASVFSFSLLLARQPLSADPTPVFV